MGKENEKVVIIGRDIVASDEVREIADAAYGLWLANGFRGGSPEEALITAVRRFARKARADLFLVPKRNGLRSNIYPLPRVPLN